MKKYLLLYLIFWLPAILVAYLFNNSSTLSQTLQWFFTFLMLFGWAVNTAMAASHFPHTTLSALFAYLGFHLIAIRILYTTDFRSGLHIVLRALGGLFSFKAMEVLKSFADSQNWWGEIAVVFLVFCCCLLGFLAGLVRRRMHPDLHQTRTIQSS